MTTGRRRWLASTGLAAVLLAAACTPGGDGGEGRETQAEDVQTDIAELGDVTLTVWDQEVRGGQAEQIEALNAAFQEEYPNVTIKRVSRSFDDLRKTLRLAISNPDRNAPDVVQANNGRSDMGQFVEAGLLQSLEGYAEAYGWEDRFPESVRALASYTEDGKDFGAGNLYGIPQVGEIVGIWYNKAKLEELNVGVPETTEDFESALAAAKEAGELPMQFGNLDGWPGIHTYGVVHNQFVPRDDIRNLGFGREGSSWTSDENVQAAETFVEWVDNEYFTEDFNGLGYDPAWQNFANGEGVFLPAGTWVLADLVDAMGDDVGFFLPPVGESGERAVTGGTGLPFSITDASENPDVAAAYIDYISSEDAMKMIGEAGNLPVVDSDSIEATGAQAEVYDAWATVGEEDSLVPYLDYATPDFYDLVTSEIQKLGSGSVTPQEFTENLEQEYSTFVSENSGD